MCDYSLHTAKHRPAKVGDRLVTRNFNKAPESPPRRMRGPQFVFFRALNSPSKGGAERADRIVRLENKNN